MELKNQDALSPSEAQMMREIVKLEEKLKVAIEALEWYAKNVSMDDLHCEKINDLVTDKVAREALFKIKAK
jgi:hypothetical protein